MAKQIRIPVLGSVSMGRKVRPEEIIFTKSIGGNTIGFTASDIEQAKKWLTDAFCELTPATDMGITDAELLIVVDDESDSMHYHGPRVAELQNELPGLCVGVTGDRKLVLMQVGFSFTRIPYSAEDWAVTSMEGIRIHREPQPLLSRRQLAEAFTTPVTIRPRGGTQAIDTLVATLSYALMSAQEGVKLKNPLKRVDVAFFSDGGDLHSIFSIREVIELIEALRALGVEVNILLFDVVVDVETQFQMMLDEEQSETKRAQLAKDHDSIVAQLTERAERTHQHLERVLAVQLGAAYFRTDGSITDALKRFRQSRVLSRDELAAMTRTLQEEAAQPAEAPHPFDWSTGPVEELRTLHTGPLGAPAAPFRDNSGEGYFDEE